MAERLGRAIEKRLLFLAELRRRKREKLLPIGFAAEQLAVPPHVAHLDRLIGLSEREERRTRAEPA